MRSIFVTVALAASCFALPPLALAQQAPKSDAARGAAGKEMAAVKAQLELKFPGATIGNVAKSPYFGLYEAQFDDRIVYTDAKVDYVLVGAVYDANTKRNLTDARLRQLNKVTWDSLPLELAFKRVKGNGTRKFAMFSDADCPYCRRIESEIQQMDDVTIYTFLYPIDQLHPDASRKSTLIWCAPDRAAAWDEYFASGRLPDNQGDCATPIQDTARLGSHLRVSATPTLVFADGSLVPGALSRDELETEINNGEVAARKQAPKK